VCPPPPLRTPPWALACALVIATATATATATAETQHEPPRGDAGVATLAMDPAELAVPVEQTEVPLVNGVPFDELHPALAGWTHPVVDSDELVPVQWQRKFNAYRDGSRGRKLGCYKNHHCGIDLSGPRGRTIVSVKDGVVVHTERRKNGRDGKSGRYVRIAHEGGVFTTYMHLDAVAPGLSVGDKVKAGQFIGRLGKSGIKHSKPHLHFNLELDVGQKEPKMIDSTPYLMRATVIPDPVRKRRRDKNNS
jgi:murein DD-endopeptidase MepM/ murein hydrolase activator NlpD